MAAATDVKFGISRNTGTLIETVTTTSTMQVAELAGSDGEIARVHPFKAMTEGTVKGHGALTVVLGIGDPGVTGLPESSVTVVTSLQNSETFEGFDGWEYSFKCYPSAQNVV